MATNGTRIYLVTDGENSETLVRARHPSTALAHAARKTLSVRVGRGVKVGHAGADMEPPRGQGDLPMAG